MVAVGKSNKQLYSIPGVTIVGLYKEEEYKGLAGFTILPYRLISIIDNGELRRKINTIPFSLGGDVVEKIFEKAILGAKPLDTLLEEHIWTMMFIGGYVVSIKHDTISRNETKPLTLFMPSTMLSYKLILDEKHDEEIPLYNLKYLIMFGFLLQEGSLKALADFCRKTNMCRTREDVVYISIWRRNILAITSKNNKSIEQSYKVLNIYPDNNPFRHITYWSDPLSKT